MTRRPRYSICSPKARRAFSLLEVVLALGILAGAIIVLGELARLGIYNARAARDLTSAQIFCESIMAEFTSGVAIPAAVSQAELSVELDPRQQWQYSVELNSTADVELLSLVVTVSQKSTASPRPVQFTLVRWIRDPDLQKTAANGQPRGGDV